MRRLLILTMCVWPMLMHAANTLSLSAASGHPGDTLTITAALTNSDELTALQADIPLGANLHYLDSSATIASARANGHSIYAAEVNDTLHITIFSLSQATFVGNEGELFSFRLVLSNEPATYALSPAVTMATTAIQAAEASVESGSATILSPKIAIVNQSIDYGHIPIRSTYTQTLRVQNTGNEPLQIADIIFSAPEFSVASSTYTIAAGQTQAITISFAPLLHGALSETVRIRSNAVNDADVYGANIAALIADPFSVNELRVQPASDISDSIVTVNLKMNNMETDIVGVQVAFKLPSQLVYVPNSASPLTRAQGLTASSIVSNDTLTLMLYSLNNTPIADTDGDFMSFQLLLNGTSGSYALRPINTMLINTAGQNMVSASYSSSVTIRSPRISGNASAAFGHVPVTAPTTFTYAVRNTGQVPLRIDGAAFLMEGFRVVTPLPITIANNSTASLEIEFTPLAEGSVATTMQLYSNDPATRMKSVAISGSVYEPNAMTMTGTTIGDQYRIEIGMDNYSDLTGLQFDLHGVTASIDAVIKSARTESHTVSWSQIEENTYRFIVFSMDNHLLQHSGTLFTLVWRAPQALILDDTTISMDAITAVHVDKGAKEISGPASLLVDYDPTDLPTGIDQISNDQSPITNKILHKGQIYILRGDKTYTIQGQEVK